MCEIRQVYLNYYFNQDLTLPTHKTPDGRVFTPHKNTHELRQWQQDEWMSPFPPLLQLSVTVRASKSPILLCVQSKIPYLRLWSH